MRRQNSGRHQYYNSNYNNTKEDESLRQFQRKHRSIYFRRRRQNSRSIFRQQKAQILHRQFPDVKISSSQLRLLQRAHNIKYKTMRSVKQLDQKQQAEIEVKRITSFKQILKLKAEQQKILYLDETIFQPYSITGKAWAHSYSNQPLFKHGCRLKTIAAAVCISREEGIISYTLQPRSLNQQQLIELLDHMAKCVELSEATMFMDNLRAHHGKIFQGKLKELKIAPLFNAPYSADFHCIEEVFAYIKHKYKQKLVESNFSLTERQHQKLIREIIEQVQQQFVQKVEERHFIKMTQFIEQRENNLEQ